VEIKFDTSDRPLEKSDPTFALALESLRSSIVRGFVRRLRTARLGLARDRFREFDGNLEAIGRELEIRLIHQSWSEADHAYYNSQLSYSDCKHPPFAFPAPMAFGYHLGALIHGYLYPERGRCDAIAELCALFNLFITIFDWITDRLPDAHCELDHVISEETLRHLSSGADGVREFQQTIESAQHPAVRILLKTMGRFFADLHASACVSVDHPKWERLNALLVQAYRAEIATSGLNHASQSLSECLAYARAKSVLPFEIILAIAVACEDRPVAKAMEDATAFVQCIGTLIQVADDVSDLVRDYRSGDANTILLDFGVRNGNGIEVAGGANEGTPTLRSDECVDSVVNRLYETFTRALCHVKSGSDFSDIAHFGDVITCYVQGWLGITELGPRTDFADDQAAGLKRTLLTDAVKIAQGVRKNGRPYAWIMDGRAALLRSDALQSATRQLWQKLRRYRPTAVGGVSLGADPVVAGLLLQAQEEGWPLKGFIIRPESKKYGLCKQVEGPDLTSRDRVALVDDLIGGGATLQFAVECIAPFGSHVVAAGGVVDLCKGGSTGLRHQGIPVETIFTESELGLTPQRPLRPNAWKLTWSVPGIYRSTYCAPKSTPTFLNGNIYMGSDAGYVACLTTRGVEQWRYNTRDTQRGVHGKPLILGQRVYFGAFDGFAYCVDAHSGALLWETHCAASIVTSATSSLDANKVYFSGGTFANCGIVVCLSAETGEMIWRHKVESPIESSPFFDVRRSRLIAATNIGFVFAIDASSGEEIWRFSVGAAVKGSVAVDPYGRCFIGGEDGCLYALDVDSGDLLWKRRISNSLQTSPLLCGDMVVSGGDSKRVFALRTETGEVCWISTLRGSHLGGAAFVSGRWIAIGCDAGIVYLLDSKNGLLVWSFETGGSIRSTPAVFQDKFLVPSTDGRLYCFGENAQEEA
jgi:outer membrane protein assembly factor BamB/orotate phosphoribosyltransferase